jgi:hypothetical protein
MAKVSQCIRCFNGQWLRLGVLALIAAGMVTACRYDYEVVGFHATANGIGGAGLGGVTSTIANTSAAGGASGGPPGGVGGTASSPLCNTNRSYSNLWTADTGTDGWVVSVDAPLTGTLTWNATTGHANPGALQANLSLPGGGGVGYFNNTQTSFGNLSDKTITAYLTLLSGGDVLAEIYALDSTWKWADGGYVTVSAGTWSCASFELDAPVHTTAGYDPTTVLQIGILIWGYGRTTILLDDFGY